MKKLENIIIAIFCTFVTGFVVAQSIRETLIYFSIFSETPLLFRTNYQIYHDVAFITLHAVAIWWTYKFIKYVICRFKKCR